MRIYLIGYMGCGKSTIGKKLAKKLDFSFLDLDEFIEENELRSIEMIFNNEGESGFRGLEKKYLKETGSKDNIVISTGGGTPCFYDNMDYMSNNGTTVYLEMDSKSLHYRLTHSKKKRPLISGLSEQQLFDFIKQHLDERKEFYENSEITVNVLGFDNKKIARLAESILLTKD